MAVTKSFEDIYEKLIMIECGGFGKVFKCKENTTGIIYAVKEVDYAGVPADAVKKVKNEVHLMLKLAHDNILKPIEFFDDTENEILYIVMDFYERGDLSKLIRESRKKKTPIPEDTVWFYLRQSLSALAYLHSPKKGGNVPIGIIIHRDIKPQNILIGNDDVIKVMDFGISRESASFMTTNTTMGTPSYLAPEVLNDKPFSIKSDIWALGLTILELCTRNRTFVGEPVMVLKQHREFSNKISLPDYSQDLCDAIGMMLIKDPQRRPSAGELLEHALIIKHSPSAEKAGSSFCMLDYTDLMHYAIKGNIQGCLGCLSLCKQRNREGKTALMLAAENGHCHIASTLLPYEGGLTMPDGTTALKIALQNANWDVASILKDEMGNKGLTESIRRMWEPDSVLVPLYGEGLTDMMRACASNDIVSAWTLKPKEARRKTSKGYTALMICARTNYFEIGRMLIDAESKIINNEGYGAIHIATMNNSLDILPSLVKNEAKLLTAKGLTALHLAAAANLTDAAQILLPKEAGCLTPQGKTAFDIAMDNNFVFLARLIAVKEGKQSLLSTSDLQVPGSMSFLLDDDSGIGTGLIIEKRNKKNTQISSRLGRVTQVAEDAVESSEPLSKPIRPNARSPEPSPALSQGGSSLRTSTSTVASSLAASRLGDDKIAAGHDALTYSALNSGSNPMAGVIAAEQLTTSAVTASTVGLISNNSFNGVQHNLDLLASIKTPLIEATIAGNVAEAKACLDLAGIPDNCGKTALMYAAESGNLEICKLLAPKEANMQYKTYTALAFAILKRNDHVVSYLTEFEAAKKVPMPSGHHHTQLMSAAEDGNVGKVCSLLYQAGCRNADGTTALMIAAKAGYADIVQILIPYERGMMRVDGGIAYKLARENGRSSAYKLLHGIEKVARDRSGDTQLMIAAATGNVAEINSCTHLLRFTNRLGKTALMVAAEHGHLEAARLLLTEARMQMIGDGWQNGATALILATRAGYLDVVKVLVDLEGNMTDSKGWFALAIASQRGYLDILNVLLPKEKNMRFRDGATALPIAAQYGQTEIVKALLPHYGKLQRSDGETALIRAAAYGRVECVKLLVDVEAGLTRTDGKTALMLAAARGYEDCMNILLPYERDIKTVDGKGYRDFLNTQTTQHNQHK
ncbi:Kinase, NEK [Giardia duodenalis]|uniref:Kinase, NEK n=1 Tax=Giardia intestinalis (strain ATCC 50803 / WB clone C6) TaxID=184922 RepID=A0A644F678_GIAIC|nr:Kinase, NEK [Giardia intestinalis]KAE8304139.1 Kinase, NEK [Giardia intestinalis]